MKNLLNTTVDRRINRFSKTQPAFAGPRAQPVIYFIMFLATFVFTACQKYGATEPINENQARSSRAANNGNQEVSNNNSALPAQTIAELFQVRAATAKYMDTTAARENGYVNTGIKLPNMGLHFANFNLVGDGKFDITKPEFLVYNKNANGNFELVAVEYGVPIDFQHPDIPPTGFTGGADEWDFNTLGLGLWTLHAWVWKTNPDGVFKMMNPIVP